MVRKETEVDGKDAEDYHDKDERGETEETKWRLIMVTMTIMNNNEEGKHPRRHGVDKNK